MKTQGKSNISEHLVEESFKMFFSHLQNHGFSGGVMLHLFDDSENCRILTAGEIQEKYGAEIRQQGRLEKRTSLSTFIRDESSLQNIRENTRKIHLHTAKLMDTMFPGLNLENIELKDIQQMELRLLQMGYKTNTVAKHLKVVKRYVNLARKEGIITHFPFLNFQIRTEKVGKRTLTMKELEKFERYRQSMEQRDEYLDAFIFSCYTGLRFSDVQNFSKQDIQNVNGSKWIIKRMVKTDYEVRIPINVMFDGKALELVKSYKRQQGRMFRIANNQMANYHIKKIGLKLGIQKISFHTARHTCATLLLYKGVNLTTIQKILGHQSVTTTQIYSAITDMTILKDLKRANRKLK